MEELYETLGYAKCEELDKKNGTIWQMLGLSDTKKNAQVRGAVLESIAKDFVREFLPVEFKVKSGLIFDTERKKTSPQCDAIIYGGVPLLEFADTVIVEKEQVKAIFEIKSYVYTPTIFGDVKNKEAGTREPDSGLALDFKLKKEFLPLEANYILFAFELSSGKTRDEIIERLKEICHFYAIVLRYESKNESKMEGERGKENWEYNFDNSVSELIKYLRNLS